jgi:hypothetical protein
MRTTAILIVLILTLGLPALAAADGWGPRVGVAMDPDLVQFGLHADLANMASHVVFQPSAEVGVGDQLTVLSLNMDTAYRFTSQWDVWSPYLGGGVDVSFVNRDDGYPDRSYTDTGLAVLGGIQRGLANGNRFFLETKIGLFDSPDLRFTAGWTFMR